MTDLLKNNEALLKKPIIFIGTGRSGTTVISEIIFQHEDLAWHSNYQELFPKFPAINYLRRAFDNRFWRFIGMNTQNNRSFTNYMLFRPIERYDFWEAVTGERIDFSRNFLLNEKATPEERKQRGRHREATRVDDRTGSRGHVCGASLRSGGKAELPPALRRLRVRPFQERGSLFRTSSGSQNATVDRKPS